MSNKPHPARETEPTNVSRFDSAIEKIVGPEPQPIVNKGNGTTEPKKRRKLVNLSPKLAALNAVEELFAEHPKELHDAMIRHAAETFSETRVAMFDKLADRLRSNDLVGDSKNQP